MNLLETVSGLLKPAVIAKFMQHGSISDESPTNVRTAVETAVPTACAGLVQLASSEDGARLLYDEVRIADNGLPSRLGTLTGTQARELSTQGQAMFGRMFGDRGAAMTDLIVRQAGIRPASAAGVMGMLMPILAGVLGREVSARNLNAGGLADVLYRQKQFILDNPRTPAGLAGALGLGSLAGLGSLWPRTERDVNAGAPQARPVSERPTVTTSAREPAKQRFSVLPWLVGALLIIGGIYAVAKRGAPKPPEVGRPELPRIEAPKIALPEAPPPPVQAPLAPLSEQLKVTGGMIELPTGKTLTLDPTSSEAGLALFLSGSDTDFPKRFAMADIQFDFNTTNVTSSSLNSVDSLAAILEAYPSARIRLEGHTDAIGNAATNDPLSERRAEALKQALVARGISADRIETSGAGSSNPIAPNDTPENRAKNRRIDVLVLNR